MNQIHQIAGNNSTVESLLEQGSSAVNEDYLCMENNVFGVFDGSTSLLGDKFSGKTGGQLAAEISANGFTSFSGSIAQRAFQVNKQIASEMAKAGLDENQRVKFASTSAAVLKIHPNNLEWGQIGDCRIILIYDDGSHKLLHDPVDHDAKSLQLMSRLGGLDACNSQEFKDQVLAVREQMNIGYGVLNGEDAAMDFFVSGLESLDGLSCALLFSDGLLLPGDDAIEKIVDLYFAGGLQEVRRHVRQLQNNDADAVIWPRFKKHDDISAIALDFSS